MLIDTRAIGFPLTEAIVKHVEARLESALRPFSRWILKTTVRLHDINADRGGIDKRVGVVVAMRRHGVEIAEATDENLYRAVDAAASRARKSVARSAKRRLGRERRAQQRPGALVAF
jgi:ribosome-associated translation inhibitor RaiA